MYKGHGGVPFIIGTQNAPNLGDVLFLDYKLNRKIEKMLYTVVRCGVVWYGMVCILL